MNLLEIDSTGGAFAKRRLELSLLQQMARMLSQLFAPYCEVVIHDFTDLEHSIVHVEGALSGRSVGGAATDMLLERVRNGETREDLHNYSTALPNGIKFKSSTIFLRDQSQGGRAYGAFCVNYDITVMDGFKTVLEDITRTEVKEAVFETLTDDIHQTIDQAISRAVNEMSVDPISLTRSEKVELIQRLDRQGVFDVRRSVSIVADRMKFSRATIYNYLRDARDTGERQA